eukprot:c17232_g1_i1.p1 GENE.c17232_g1_i1~~c17232_g1_i1.p1  ORF type:complete len:267 (-),score=120.25 c17232_g1_i1:3-782(-)
MNSQDYTLLGISLIDHTSLNDSDTNSSILSFLESTVSPSLPQPAAVCIYPQFVSLAKSKYPSLKVATVINFPKGDASHEDSISETEKAIQDGADEIDLVINYKLILQDKEKGLEEATSLVSKIKKVCTTKIPLKVICETGELKESDLIKLTSEAVIKGGCDFLKTSTGKVPINCTPEAATVMLSVISETKKETGKDIGLKVAGGVRSLDDTIKYISMVEKFMGKEWVNPTRFRIGSSELLSHLRSSITSTNTTTNSSGY